MKILTLNFLTCARKSCKTSPDSFPLHPADCELEGLEVDYNGLLLRNILPRLEWPALRQVCQELGLPGLPEDVPEAEVLVVAPPEGGQSTEGPEVPGEASQVGKDLHKLLFETGVKEGKLVCGNCQHEYEVREGIANFLLPAHLV